MQYSTDVPAAQYVGNLGIWQIFEVAPGHTVVFDPRPVPAGRDIDPQTDHENMYKALEYIRAVEGLHEGR